MQDDAAIEGLGVVEEFTLNNDEAVDALARLKPLERDQNLKDYANALGVRQSTLRNEVNKLLGANRSGKGARDNAPGRALSFETIEPSSEPVDGDELIDEIVAAIKRFVALPDTLAHAVALWVLFAHTFEAYEVSPRLFVTSPEKRCGKSTLLKVIRRLTPKPMLLSNASPSAMFRIADAEAPTLILDEADGYVKESEDFRNLINAGHEIDNCAVARNVGEGANMTPSQFRIWCPLVVAAIGRLQGTIEDRSIVISMSRRKPSEQVEKARRRNLVTLAPLAGRVARWAADNVDRLSEMVPDVPEQLNDRASDNWEPLLCVADCIGGRWSQVARKTAIAMDQEATMEDDESAAVMLLADCWQVFEDMNTDRLRSAELVEALVELDGRPWCEWRRGNPITQNGLARLLRTHAITPTSLRATAQRGNGYYKRAFVDAYERYVLGQKECFVAGSPDSNLATVTTGANLPKTDNSNLDIQGCMSRLESAEKPQNSGECHGCKVENPPEGEKEGEL